MRKIIGLIGGIAVLALVNFSIYQKEQLLSRGRVILLELAPVDPRSLMQGDYMALRFGLEDKIRRDENLRDGYIVVALDDRGVAKFRRVEDALPLGSDEFRILYRVREGQIKIGTNAFFFQEGDQRYYQGARYGEARV